MLFDHLACVFMKKEERKYSRKNKILGENKMKGNEGNSFNVYFQIC